MSQKLADYLSLCRKTWSWARRWAHTWFHHLHSQPHLEMTRPLLESGTPHTRSNGQAIATWSKVSSRLGPGRQEHTELGGALKLVGPSNPHCIDRCSLSKLHQHIFFAHRTSFHFDCWFEICAEEWSRWSKSRSSCTWFRGISCSAWTQAIISKKAWQRAACIPSRFGRRSVAVHFPLLRICLSICFTLARMVLNSDLIPSCDLLCRFSYLLISINSLFE